MYLLQWHGHVIPVATQLVTSKSKREFHSSYQVQYVARETALVICYVVLGNALYRTSTFINDNCKIHCQNQIWENLMYIASTKPNCRCWTISQNFKDSLHSCHISSRHWGGAKSIPQGYNWMGSSRILHCGRVPSHWRRINQSAKSNSHYIYLI